MTKHYVFDKAYYHQFYGYPRIRASDANDVRMLADFVFSYLLHVGQPVRRVLDMGCGLGLWRDAIVERYPNVRYVGVEVSNFLCQRYGWTPGSVVTFEARVPFDLVICADVLQYLSHAHAAAAIDNLARLCRGALYFNVLTRQDWEENCDQERTNGDVYLRRSEWYRHRLKRHFSQMGGGLFLSRRSSVVLWELEKLE